MTSAYASQGVAPEPTRTLGDRVRQSALLLACFVVVGVALAGVTGAAFRHSEAVSPSRSCVGQNRPANLAALALAGSQERADAVMRTWKCSDRAGDARADADKSLRRDSWFLVPAYVLAISVWCLYVHWAGYRDVTRRLAVAAIVGVFTAGALDAFVENVALRRIVAGDRGWGWPIIASAASIPKFVLLAVGLAVGAVGLGSALRTLLTSVVVGSEAGPQFFGRLSESETPLIPPHSPTDDSERRSRRSLDPHGAPWPEGQVGICLSGGGIRAASFALGAIRALQQPGDGDAESPWERARYLSTVSGGGYAGTAAQVLAHQDQLGEPPISDSDLQKLCDSRRFLWGSPRDVGWRASTRAFVTATSLFGAGVLFNLLLVGACVYVIAHPLGWFVRSTMLVSTTGGSGVVADLTPGGTLGIALGATALALVAWSTLRRGWLYGSVGLLFLCVVIPVELAFNTRSWMIVPVAGLAAVALQRMRSKVRNRKEVALTFGGGLVYGLVAALSWLWVDQGLRLGPDGRVTRLPALAFGSIAVGIIVAISVGALARLAHASRWKTGEATVVWWTGTVVSLLAAVASGFGMDRAFRSQLSEPYWTDLSVWLVVSISVALVYAFGDQKRWSPHPLYKARLGRSFALTRAGGPPSGPRQRDPLPWRIQTTLSEWAAKPDHGPELLIGAAVYDTNTPHDIPAWPFLFSHRHIGGADVGWARTVDFEAVLGRRNQSDGTLLAAMAISGAAVSPALGRISLGPVNAGVAALNARLGVWLPSPSSIHKMRSAGGPKPSWLRTRRFTYLFKEIVGSYDIDARLVYVTDGGQVDNLGLLELLARRCKTIYCFDASGDLKPGRDLTTSTFDQTRELASSRLGVSIHGLEALNPLCTPDDSANWGTAVPIALANTAAFAIRYAGGEVGTLYYAKCLLTADVPVEVANYAQSRTGRRRFPADSTIDQWPDAAQFEAYVALGEHVGGKLVALSTTTSS